MLAVAAGGLLLIAPFRMADRLADRVKEGKSVIVPVLPGVTGLRVEPVRAFTADDSPLGQSFVSGGCVHLLGSNAEVVVLYDAQTRTVLRVPAGSLSLTHTPVERPEDDSTQLRAALGRYFTRASAPASGMRG